MNLLELRKYFQGKITARDFIELEKSSLLEYIIETKVHKKSIPVRAEYQELFAEYDRKDIAHLLNDYLKQEIREWELDYIMQGLDMLDEDPSDEKARFVVSSLATPEIESPISKDVVVGYLNYLNGESGVKKHRSRMAHGRNTYRSILLAE